MEKIFGYELRIKESTESFMIFEFISEGNRGIIPKLIRFFESPIKGIFYSEFGDQMIGSEKIDITVVSNNGDRAKVYATVRAAIYAFTEHYPEAWVFLNGNKKVKDRFIRMEVTKYYDYIEHDFIILGLGNGKWVDFQKNVDYMAVICKRKGKNHESERPNPELLQLVYKRYRSVR